MRQMDMEAANKKRKWNTRRSIAAGVITLVACAVSLGMGRYAIAPYDVLRAICDLFTGSDTVSDTMRHVVCFVRVPRIFGALLCGAGLAAAGAGFQAVFANPLATPDTLGVGNAASFGGQEYKAVHFFADYFPYVLFIYLQELAVRTEHFVLCFLV